MAEGRLTPAVTVSVAGDTVSGAVPNEPSNPVLDVVSHVPL